LKITPGHDPNDYAIGQRFNLPILSMLDESAHVTSTGGPYEGMDRFACRKKIWADMTLAGLVIKEQPYTLNVPRTQRGGEIVEPMISTQWFVKIKPMAEAGIEAVRNGRITIVPERFTKVYYNWLENIQDWCISRQLWWGHRIPVWYCQDCGEMVVSRVDPTECTKCHGSKLEQDPDVLDTWFSSGLWPFSTLGWPEETPDYKYFYPTSILETGYDILFFWVARMIMDGIEFTGKPPFHTVYLHGIIRDEHGVKMSKTKGNVIDPLGIMDEMGTDALRFTLLVGSAPGNDMSLSAKKVEANRNFINKIWNVGRFVISTLPNAPEKAKSPAQWTLADQWIQTRHQQLVRDVNRLFDVHQYGEAGRQIYEFFWSEFADWYLEIAKLQMAEGGDRAYYTAQTLMTILDTSLRLLHPFVPFITEELWGNLKATCKYHPSNFAPKSGWRDALMISEWPESTPETGDEEDLLQNFILVMEIVRAIRNFRTEKNVKPGTKLEARISAGEKTSILSQQAGTIAALAHLDKEKISIVTHSEKSENQPGMVISGVEIFLTLEEVINKEEERQRLEAELKEVLGQVERLQTLLGSSFAERAPAAVVEKEKQKLAAFQDTAAKLKQQLSSMS
jgi:valyl-tRNA synthetase